MVLNKNRYAYILLFTFFSFLFGSFEIGGILITFSLLSFYVLLVSLIDSDNWWIHPTIFLMAVVGLFLIMVTDSISLDLYLFFALVYLIILLFKIVTEFYNFGILETSEFSSLLLRYITGCIKISPLFIHLIKQRILDAFDDSGKIE